MNPYDALNIPTDADDATVKKAYRKAAQDTHPDREGGNQEQFAIVASAYQILSDPDRRARYDATGETDEQPRDMAESKLAELFNVLIEEGDLSGNIIDKCRGKVAGVIHHVDGETAKLQAKLMKLDKQLGRIVSTGEFNLYEQLLTSKIADLNRQVDHMSNERELIKRVEEMLNDYEDSSPEIIMATQFGPGTWHQV